MNEETIKSEAGSLYNAAFKLLSTDQRPLLTISQQSGVSFHWLKKFKEGTVQNPSVNTIQKLYEFLSGKPIRLEK